MREEEGGAILLPHAAAATAAIRCFWPCCQGAWYRGHRGLPEHEQSGIWKVCLRSVRLFILQILEAILWSTGLPTASAIPR